MEGLGVGIVSGILLLKTVFAPHIVLSLGGPHNAHAAAQSAVVHAAAQTPLVRLWVVDLDGFQIGGPIKTAHRIQLSIHDGQANLQRHDFIDLNIIRCGEVDKSNSPHCDERSWPRWGSRCWSVDCSARRTRAPCNRPVRRRRKCSC